MKTTKLLIYNLVRTLNGKWERKRKMRGSAFRCASCVASVALVSLLVISVFTLILVLGVAEVSITKSYQYFNNASNQNVYYVAEGCLDEALIRLEADPLFNGTTLTLDADTSCTVTISGSTTKIISIVVNFLNYTQTYQAQASLNEMGEAHNLTFLQWQEI